MHPRHTNGFEWDDGNAEELAQPHHPITPLEAEQVFYNGPVWAGNKGGESGEWKMIGYTDGGRALTLIVIVNEETEELRIITGWDCTRGERTRYLAE